MQQLIYLLNNPHGLNIGFVVGRSHEVWILDKGADAGGATDKNNPLHRDYYSDTEADPLTKEEVVVTWHIEDANGDTVVATVKGNATAASIAGTAFQVGSVPAALSTA